MINSGQQAQAVNILRSTLLVVRDYALTRGVPAGVRFQDDGRVVPIYATNAGQHDATNYRTSGGGNQLPGQPANPFQMHAIPGMAPSMMPGMYRVTCLDYTYQGYGSNEIQQTSWWITPNWFTGQEWFLTSVLLFSSRGRAIQARVQFPQGWAPASTGSSNTSYDRWLSTTTTYYYQGDLVPSTGPSVSTDFRVYDYGAVQPYMSQAAFTGTGGTPNEQMIEGWRLMERTGSDFVVDSNTGRLIRKGADLAVEQ
jgi:hypothetical protein